MTQNEFFLELYHKSVEGLQGAHPRLSTPSHTLPHPPPPDFETILAQFLDNFGIILKQFWDDLGDDFGPFSGRF
jgi:hypothetical protein